MARDFRELIREDIRNNPEFAAGLYRDCINLLQSEDSEDRDTGESMIRNYFGADALHAARLQADTPVEPANNAAN